MAFEGHGTENIRGPHISRTLKGFSDEEFFFKSLVTEASTSSREIRWYKRQTGVIDTTASQGMSSSRIDEGAEISLLEVSEQKVERQTSRTKIFGLESPWISEEDFMDTDVQIVALNQRHVPRAVVKSGNDHIYNVISENQTPVDIETTAAVATWNNATTANIEIVKDIETAKEKIMLNNYDPDTLWIHPTDYKNMIVHFIQNEGANVPGFSSQKVEDGIITEILGLRVVKSNSVAADSVLVAAAKQAVTYWQFSPLKVVTIFDERTASYKIVCRERGLATLTDPGAVHLTTNTIT